MANNPKPSKMNSHKNDFPEGKEMREQVASRQRRGLWWRTSFVVATMVGIVALVALLYNVINSSFGYVAIQNRNEPSDFLLSFQENQLLNASGVTTGENDAQLANRTAKDPYAVSFFGYSYYQRKADDLRALSIDGVAPSEDVAISGEYPFARPLFLYSSESTLLENPAAGEFMRFYLENFNEAISDVGYFAVSDEVVAANLAKLDNIVGAETEVKTGVDDGAIVQVTGSSTVFPLTRALRKEFGEVNAAVDIDLSSGGTSAGLAEFCKNGSVDIVNASRVINRGEAETCKKSRKTPVEFEVGVDAVTFVVSQKNDFATDLTMAQAQALFTTAELWSDVNPEWPSEPIVRYIPGENSGTLDFVTESLFSTTLESLPKESLIAILNESREVSAAKMRQWDSELSFAERTQGDVLGLVQERVIDPQIVDSWDLYDSLFNRDIIEAEANQITDATLTFRNWLTLDFITSAQSSTPEDAGIRTAIFGSLWVILITVLFSLPLGVGAAIYLEEYASDNWFSRLIETNINNLAGVPSIIYGMLGLAIFVRTLEALTSGRFFGAAVDPSTANGRTILSAGLTLGLLILPIIIINAREAIRAVPGSLRQASYGLGATRWQTIWNHVLPSALPGILTGNILAMSRAIGETAPLVVIGASTTIFRDPTGPFSKFTTLPIQIYQWTARPQEEFRFIAAAAIIVLLLLLLTLNATAVALRNRYSTKSV